MKRHHVIGYLKLLRLPTLTIILSAYITPCYATYTSPDLREIDSDSLPKSRRYYGRVDVLPQIGGPELVGVEVNAFLSPKLSVNVGGGIFRGFHLGTNYYLYRKSKRAPVAPYIGFQVFSFSIFPGPRYPGWYVPMGFEYASRGRFTLQFEVGVYRMYLESRNDSDALIIFIPAIAALRVGVNVNKRH
jgi:hypothetical protein